MIEPKSFRWRKCTDNFREFAYFELLADGVEVLDVGFSDRGILEVCFYQGIAGVLIEWSKLQELIEAGKRIAELDREGD